MSQTEGKLTFPPDFVKNNVEEVITPAASIHNVPHHAKLRLGLRDLSGNAVLANSWGLEFAEDEFALTNLEFLNVYSSEEEEEEPDPLHRQRKKKTMPSRRGKLIG